jgi:DNA-binding transcriptional ArsR family regulator
VSSPADHLAALDRLIHEPARLAITSALSACDEADFRFLQRLTGLSKGNLSSHLSKLEAAGIVEISKTFAGKKPETWVRLSVPGQQAVHRHWQRLDELRPSGGVIETGTVPGP